MKLNRDFIKNKIAWWEMVLRVWDRCDVQPEDSASAAACKLFIRTQNTKNLRTDLVRHGYKIRYDVKISDLITKNEIDDKEILRVARELFKVNKEHEGFR